MEKSIKENAEKLKQTTETAGMFLAETRLQFDTLVQLQMEERQRMLEQAAEEKDKMRKHYGRIIVGLVATLILVIGSVVGAIIYILGNYEFTTSATIQEIVSDNYSYSAIYDGIHAVRD